MAAPLDLQAIEDALRYAGKTFVMGLDPGAARDKAEKLLWGATQAIGRARTASTEFDKQTAQKEVRDFEDAFNLSFGTMEIRGAEAAREALFTFGKQLVQILLKAAVGLLV